ncbi:hypothetical protein BKA65DRAFT_174501 [Rhexocercosporidium sp. MPI-PUGE-AT-0058]|nr:hypothetical protein BKA65DRAFT_174501 [Rhexocercosporidium sp. MPI-PUGE-AT-0058]
MELKDTGMSPSGPPTALFSMSNELILLIFEELRLCDLALDDDQIKDWQLAAYKTLPILRLVCKRFNKLATPIRYRNFTIHTHSQIRARRSQAKSVRKRVAEDVKRSTEHATVGGKINWHHVVRNHGSLPRLKTISWYFHAHSEDWVERNLYAIPASILRPGVTISISGTGHYHKFTSLVPPEHVSSLLLGYWHPSQPYEFEAHDAIDSEYNPKFKDYILRAKNLENLNYDLATVSSYLGGAAPKFPAFVAGEKLPALKSLVLTGYHWLHTKEEVKTSWNFSKLEHLDITGMNHDDFFKTVDARWIPNLRELRLGTFVWRGPSILNRRGNQIRLHHFLRKMPQLEVLSMNSYTDNFPLDILMAMENLRVLEFTENVASQWEDGPPPRLNIQDLEELLQYLPQLEHLHIDFETWSGDFKRTFLDTVSQFPALKHIHVNNHGCNKDPSDEFYNTLATRKLAPAKMIFIHYGQYVNAGVSGWYNCGKRRWERFTSTLWLVAGQS